MTATYFRSDISTLEELKKEYHVLSMVHHPDVGGTVEAMQAINNEYSALFEVLKNQHVNSKGEHYTKDTTETANEFIDLVGALLVVPNITVEVCGSWVWVTGDTKPCKDTLKDLGFKWANNKKAWYYHKGEYRKWGKRAYTMDEIRKRYGSDVLQAEKAAPISA